MAVTTVRGGQVKDGSIQRVDVDVSTVGQALITKALGGTYLTDSATGADAGTGDVTLDLDAAQCTGTGKVVRDAGATLDPANITGTNTNDNAAAGAVGEIVSSALASTSAVSYTNAQTKNLTSISLTAGDWEVGGIISWACSSFPTGGFYAIAQITSTTGVITDDGEQSYAAGAVTAGPGNIFMSCQLPDRRVSLASTTTIYLVGRAPGFASGTCSAWGYIEARRVR